MFVHHYEIKRNPVEYDAIKSCSKTGGRTFVFGGCFFMKLIPLTRGKFAQVDDEDFERLNKLKWNADKAGDTWYATRLEQKNYKRTKFKMHRFILGITDSKILVDHKDRNGLNNQKSNLRIATRSQNNANRKSGKNAKSKYLGVTIKKYKNSTYYHATMTFNQKRIHIGSYKTEEEAARAYDKVAKINHGEFANLNFPEKI
jgi:hypothetical protein